MSGKKTDIKLVIQIFLTLLLFVYIILRANNLSFTHDESYTFKFLLGLENPSTTANNHLLNTALMKFSGSIFGMSEFSLRLPNVLSFLFYAFGYFLISRKIKSVVHSWILFILFFFNPVILEFFSLARGYGLSLGFLVISIYGFIRVLKAESFAGYLRYSILAFSFGILAMYSNLSVINYYLAMYVILAFALLKKLFNQTWIVAKLQKLILIFFYLTALIPLFYLIKRLLFLSKMGELYFGTEGFMETINTFVFSSLYHIPYRDVSSQGFKIVIFILIVFGLIFLILNRKRKLQLDILILFPLIILGYYLEHLLFDSKFPKGRTALFLYPILLFYLMRVGETFTYYLSNKHLKFFAIITIPAVVLIMINFGNSVNLTHSSTWKYDANTKNMCLELAKISELNDEPISISNNWLFEPTMNYYKNLLGINCTEIDRRGIDSTTIYIYDFSNNIDTNAYFIINEYEISETSFAKRKKLTFTGLE